MEEIESHHHHRHNYHHHHGHGTSHESEGHQDTSSSQGALDSSSTVAAEQHQQQVTVQPTTSLPSGTVNTPANQSSGGVQPASSFHSVSSIDSSAEMATYFPNAQTPDISTFRHQQGVEGQSQSTATSNTAVTTQTNTVNAGPYIPVSAPTAVQRFPQPVRPPVMPRQQQQQQQQGPIRPQGSSQQSSGIPSYSSHIEGLSVSQAVVNDVLVDLQTKVLNETVQQYQQESTSGSYLEPLPPIYIQAPQPTIILRSDLHRLRAELGQRVRPPVVYRHPAGANQFQQQHQFQQNMFQAPRFPAPPQQHIPPESYGQYRNPIYSNSDEYKTTTTGDEHRKEKEERWYNQAGSPMLNDDNINDNVHSAFDLQGLSTASFDRHASPYQSSSFYPNLEDQQQGNEGTLFTSSHNINDEAIGQTDNMYSTPARPRPEITFDINNCILRCFEAHRERVARRRAARQARRAKRHKQSGQHQQQQQQQHQQLYHTDQYQNFPTQPTYSSFDSIGQTQWQQQPSSSSHYSDIIPGPTDTSNSIHTSQSPYIPTGTYDYTNIAQSTSLPTDIQQTEQKQNFDYSSQALSSSDYYQEQPVQVPISQAKGGYSQPTGTFEYSRESYQSQEPIYNYQDTDQQASQYNYNVEDIQQVPQQESYNYDAAAASTYSPPQVDANLTEQRQTFDYSSQALSSSDYYQQQPTSISTSEVPEAYAQSSGTFEYATGTTQSQEPAYNYQNVEQISSQYPYNIDNIPQQQSFDYTTGATGTYIPPETNIQQTEQRQTFDYSDQALNSSDYYQQQPVHVPISQAQETYAQSSDYTTGTTQSQEPAYNYQNIEQISSQNPYNIDNIAQHQSFDYTSGSTDVQQTEQKQTFDYSNQALSSSDYYQEQPVHVPISQAKGGYSQPTGTFEYSRESYQSQEPIYNYQGTDQQASQYNYNAENIHQVPEQDLYNYANSVTSTLSLPDANIEQLEQKQTVDYSNQTFHSSDHYEQQPIHVPISQVQDQTTGTFEYNQEPVYDYQGANQQSSQYSYNLEGIQQEQPQQQDTFNYTSEATIAYSAPETDIQQTEQKQTNDYSSQAFSSSDYYQQQPTSIPISQVSHSQQFDQQLSGASVPTGTVEYTRESYYSQEPLSDNYTTENFIKQFESESQSEQYGGQIKSSDDRQSVSTIATTPFIIQQNADIYSSEGASQTYDIQNYTNEAVVSETSQLPPYSSISYEEDQQHLLQQTLQHSEREASSYDTYSSLPPPPGTEDIDYHQESIATNASDFPPPPTPDRHTYHVTPQRPSRSITSIIPSADQPSIYTEQQQPIQSTSPPSSDGTDDDNKEDEEIFDLRQCIAKCYAKYQDLWNKEEQRKYEERISDVQQPQLSRYTGSDTIHCTDGWSQTRPRDVIRQSNIAQYTHDETSSSFDTKPYISDLSADTRGQQTIEYSPPLITQTRHITPSIPPSSYEYSKHEEQQQQQQQPIYDHTLPIPPHLSFNDTDYQPNLYFPSQITAQPRQHENIPLNKYEEEQQQQRYRAHSEPASIQPESIGTIPLLQPPESSSQIFEQQTGRSISIPMIHQQQTQPHIPSIRLLDDGRSYETESLFERRVPRIDPNTGLCLVPCPETRKYAHLPPHLRPELFCVELPPPSTLPPMPPPRPYQQQQHHQQHQQQRYCVKCCCVPGQTLIKKIVYKEVEEGGQQQEESGYDYASVIDQMATKISVRYGNSIMEEGDAFTTGNYHEQLRVIDFPVYVSGKNDQNLTPLVPVN